MEIVVQLEGAVEARPDVLQLAGEPSRDGEQDALSGAVNCQTDMAQAGEMASTLLHELSQSLTAILHYADACDHALTAGADGDRRVADWLTRISGQAFHAGRILRQIRRCAVRSRGDRPHVDREPLGTLPPAMGDPHDRS